MKRAAFLVLALALVAPLSGCMPTRSPAIGLLYTDVMGPIDTEGSLGSKKGEACSQSILSLVAQGDSSIAAAAKDGGITKITSVDHHSTNILGIIGTFCTIVYGS